MQIVEHCVRSYAQPSYPCANPMQVLADPVQTLCKTMAGNGPSKNVRWRKDGVSENRPGPPQAFSE